MIAQSAPPAGGLPSSDRASLGRLIVIPLACLALGQALLALSGALPMIEGALADPDSFVRVARALHLQGSGAWLEARFARIDPPAGHLLPCTRPLDAPLLAEAWLLQPALGFARAPHLSGVLISPACPEILYPTPHSVPSIPNHRPQPGFAATWRALTARDDIAARAILEEPRVNLTLLGPTAVERSVFGPADGGRGHRCERLVDGPILPRLRALPVPRDLASAVRRFAVLPAPASASRRGTDPRLM